MAGLNLAQSYFIQFFSAVQRYIYYGIAFYSVWGATSAVRAWGKISLPATARGMLGIFSHGKRVNYLLTSG